MNDAYDPFPIYLVAACVGGSVESVGIDSPVLAGGEKSDSQYTWNSWITSESSVRSTSGVIVQAQQKVD